MFIKTKYSFKQMVLWTRFETLGFIVFSTTITLLYDQAGWKFLQLPWPPIALLGTAVAFIVGFQNNITYNRVLRARQIWGKMVTASRSWSMNVRSMILNEDKAEEITDEEIRRNVKTLVYRHLAWLTALRHAMRQPRPWETFMTHKTNREWKNVMPFPERQASVMDDLRPYLSDDELKYIDDKSIKASAIIFLQAEHLSNLKSRGLIWKFSYLELQRSLNRMLELQGQTEGVKNFPYPRQYVTMSHYIVWILIILLPFGILPAFDQLDILLSAKHDYSEHTFIWLTIPFCTILSWVFHTMQRIGTIGENPFEGTSNDVPISTIARATEIELRELMDEDKDLIPDQFPIESDVVM